MWEGGGWGYEGYKSLHDLMRTATGAAGNGVTWSIHTATEH